MGNIQVPKPLLELGGKPILDWTLHTIDMLQKEVIIGDTIIVVGHLGEQISQRYNDKQKVLIAKQGELKGNAAALWYGLERTNNTTTDVLVLQGDDSAFYTVETLERLIAEHSKRNGPITVLVTQDYNPSCHRYYFVVDNKLGIIGRKFSEDMNSRDPHLFYTGALCLNVAFARANFPLLPVRVNNEIAMPDYLPLAYENGYPIPYVIAKAREWQSINTMEELEQANARFAYT